MLKCAAQRERPRPAGRTMKSSVPTRASKEERATLSTWPLRICYRGVICHGAKWHRWKKVNRSGSLRSFFRFRARKAARGREEIRAFWERRGVVFALAKSPSHASEASTSSTETPEDVVAVREYSELIAANAPEEELLAWARRREEWDFVP